jgi:membrane-associated HD superfamily phosphohydrolase
MMLRIIRLMMKNLPVLRHALFMFLYPREEWRVIALEAPSPTRLLTHYIAPFSFAMALAVSLGVAVFNQSWDMDYGYRVAPERWFETGIATFAISMITVLLFAAMIDCLAPLYKTPRDYRKALIVATMGTLPFWVSAFTLFLLPAIIPCMFAFAYSCYLYSAGLEEVLAVKPSMSHEYVAIAAVFLSLALMVLGAVLAALGWF